MIPGRIAVTLSKALGMGMLTEKTLLDCYNNSVIKNGIAYTITTRIDGSNHYWVYEVDEK